jgi:2-amino-4-hydroxy-6-hydroxymethyldihydropteridine diphosphokinase
LSERSLVHRWGKERVFLGIGSNMGRRPDNMRRALRLLRETTGIKVVRTSFLYKTKPVGYTPQRDFLNGAVEIRASLPPRKLLKKLQEIEKRMGKQVLFTDGPRKIDIDLLLFGQRVSKKRDLVLPHPRLHLRTFVLVPLRELAPRLKHPVTGRTVTRMLRDCRGDGGAVRWGEWEPAPAGAI